MLSENNQADTYLAGTAADMPGTPFDMNGNGATPDPNSAERLTGFVWMPNETLTPATNNPQANNFALRINGDRDYLAKYAPPSGSTYNYLYSRPSSDHPGGVNVAMCGGELFFMRDDIDYPVYQQLMSSNAPKSDIDNKNNILNDSDYK
jgi:prepilin-type processing-associated H-X9-DG protein